MLVMGAIHNSVSPKIVNHRVDHASYCNDVCRVLDKFQDIPSIVCWTNFRIDGRRVKLILEFPKFGSACAMLRCYND